MASLILTAALAVVAVAALMATWQLLRGPDTPTRAASMDVLTSILLPLIVGLAVKSGRGIYIDVSMVYALLSFLGVLSLARYFDRGL